jgi:hypothetical protein
VVIIPVVAKRVGVLLRVIVADVSVGTHKLHGVAAESRVIGSVGPAKDACVEAKRGARAERTAIA